MGMLRAWCEKVEQIVKRRAAVEDSETGDRVQLPAGRTPILFGIDGVVWVAVDRARAMIRVEKQPAFKLYPLAFHLALERRR